MGPSEGIRMDRDEQIGTDLLRLYDSVSKFYEVVAVSNEHAPHVRLSIHQCLQSLGDCQRDVFFVCATAPLGARVCAAMPRVDRYGDQSRNIGCEGRLPRFDGGRGGCAWEDCDGLLRWFRRWQGCRNLLLVQQRQQRIDRLDGINVERQQVTAFADSLGVE